MPGAIQVSVLEFMAFRSSSSSVSQMFIKVSMGKREYQTKDKGDFSFPLTTLRDQLIVTLEDAEGKQVSKTVVETRLIIEKGIWDDRFHFESGGYVHMKLQFVLSDEDRNRIRVMRESALRKKHDELVKSPPRSTSTDTPKALLRSEVIQADFGTISRSSYAKSEKSDPEDKKPNDTDRYEDTSSTTLVLHRFDGRPDEVNRVRPNEKHPFQTPAKLKDDKASDREKQSTTEKKPSKIWHMISAFESSLSQPSKTRVEGFSGSSRNSKRDIQQTESVVGKREERIGIRIKRPADDLKDETKVEQKVQIEEEETSPEDSRRVSTSGRASVSGRMLNERGSRTSSNLSGRRRPSVGKEQEQKTERRFKPNDAQQTDDQVRTSGYYHYSSECSDAWIFPEGGKRLCITTSGKQIVDIMGGFISEAKNQLGKLSSRVAENEKQIREEDTTSGRRKESKIDGSTDAEPRRGPVGQVMRIVIMVGFATLVLFTRQRKQGNRSL